MRDQCAVYTLAIDPDIPCLVLQNAPRAANGAAKMVKKSSDVRGPAGPPHPEQMWANIAKRRVFNAGHLKY